MVKSKLNNLLTKEEQKLLQKYDILETLFDYWENLEKENSQSLDKNSHKNDQKVATWQEVLSQIFDKNKLQKIFEQQILNKNSEKFGNQKSPNENYSSQNLENLNQARNLKKQDKKFTKNDLLAKISKLENNTTNVTMETILRVFGALKAKVSFNVELQNDTILIAS